MFKTTSRQLSSRSGFLTTGYNSRNIYRHASTYATNDPKSIKLLQRLDKFNKKEKIFEKLDELCHLSAQKGFFNLDLNDLQFLSNDKKIQNNIKNLYNFNNLNKLVSDQYASAFSILSKPVTTAPSPNNFNSVNKSTMPNSANLSPLPRHNENSNLNKTIKNIKNSNKINFNSNSNIFHATSNLSPAANSLPGLNAFLSSSHEYSNNKSVDKYLNVLHGLARNDVELKKRIEQVLEAFKEEDDYFFDYVLKFWQRGKSFNKQRAQKLRDETGNDQLPINLTMH